jgi:hypothetical protein
MVWQYLQFSLRYPNKVSTTSENKLVLEMAEAVEKLSINQKQLNVAINAANPWIDTYTAYTDTQMKVVVVNSELTLIFRSPIVDESKLYHFYRVKALPVFIHNRTFTPVIDANYIAISHAVTDYISMPSDEFSRCTTTPAQC